MALTNPADILAEGAFDHAPVYCIRARIADRTGTIRPALCCFEGISAPGEDKMSKISYVLAAVAAIAFAAPAVAQDKPMMDKGEMHHDMGMHHHHMMMHHHHMMMRHHHSMMHHMMKKEGM
jgi:hypothetical protein